MDSNTAELDDALADVRYRAPDLSAGGIDFGLLKELTGFSVKLVWLLGHGLLSRALDERITPHRYSLLEVIGRNPGLQQTQLADALALSRPATTLGVNFWEERGCVERRDIPDDRRSFGIFVTARGKRELTRLRKIVRHADEALTAGFDDAERAELRRLLGKIHR